MDGILNINKPAGITSHDVVDQLRRLLREKKVGHTGTLDPDATGVLPICLGKATKIIQFLQDHEKGYEGTISLGIATDTLDSSGKILSVSDSTQVKLDDVKSVFRRFIGEMDQVPPMVSAVKFQGRRLYSIARQGKTVKREPRRIHIYDLDLLDFRRSKWDARHWVMDSELSDIGHPESGVELDFRVRCSRGTYVRVLAADIGDALGCGAHLARLIRIKSGIFELKDSIQLEKVKSDPDNAFQFMRSIDEVLSFIPRIVVTDLARDRFLNGVPVKSSGVVRCKSDATELRVDDLMRIHDEAGKLLGIGKATKTYSPAATLDPGTVICKAVKVLRRT